MTHAAHDLVTKACSLQIVLTRTTMKLEIPARTPTATITIATVLNVPKSVITTLIGTHQCGGILPYLLPTRIGALKFKLRLKISPPKASVVKLTKLRLTLLDSALTQHACSMRLLITVQLRQTMLVLGESLHLGKTGVKM